MMRKRNNWTNFHAVWTHIFPRPRIDIATMDVSRIWAYLFNDNVQRIVDLTTPWSLSSFRRDNGDDYSFLVQLFDVITDLFIRSGRSMSRWLTKQKSVLDVTSRRTRSLSKASISTRNQWIKARRTLPASSSSKDITSSWRLNWAQCPSVNDLNFQLKGERKCLFMSDIIS